MGCLEDAGAILARQVGDEICPAHVALGELGEVVDVAVQHHPAIFRTVVFCHLDAKGG